MSATGKFNSRVALIALAWENVDLAEERLDKARRDLEIAQADLDACHEVLQSYLAEVGDSPSVKRFCEDYGVTTF